MECAFYDKCWYVIVDKYRIKNDLIATLFFFCAFISILTVITNSPYSIMFRINSIRPTVYYYHVLMNIDITRRISTVCVRTNDAILESNNVINTCITSNESPIPYHNTLLINQSTIEKQYDSSQRIHQRAPSSSYVISSKVTARPRPTAVACPQFLSE